MQSDAPAPTPEPKPYRLRPRFVSRRLVLAPDDMDLVAAAIQAAAPGTVFVENSWPSSQEKPKLSASDRLSATLTSSNPSHIVQIYPLMRTWRPDWVWHETSEKWDDCWPGKWYPNGPIRFCGYIRTEELPGGDVEFVPEGEIYFRCRQERPEDMKLARKIMRALSKVMSNKNLGHTYAPAFPPPRPTEKGYPVWVGHEARAWARAAPNRLLMPYRGPREGTLAGLRPLD